MPQLRRQRRRLRVRARQQAVEIGKDLARLLPRVLQMPRRVADDAGGAGDQQQPRRHQHGAGKRGRSFAVLTRIPIGGHLAWILQRDAGLAARQPVELQDSPTLATADDGRRRMMRLVKPVEARDPSRTEVAIPLRVTDAHR